MDIRARTVFFVAASSLMAGIVISRAGPLDPPAGPVSPTYKTLSEVEPRRAINSTNTPGDTNSVYRITQGGSYYLTGNISGASGKHGIEIAASGVSIDLCGFEMVGTATALDGITISASSLTNIEIRNGSLRQWGGTAVNLNALSSANCRVSDMRVYNNDGYGIATSNDSTVTGCSALKNDVGGILVSAGCQVIGCTSSQNAGFGIATGSGCTVTECTARSNSENGFAVGTGSTVARCTSDDNVNHGMSLGTGTTASECTSYSNGGNGISAISGSTISRCTVRENTGDGIYCITGCYILQNLCTTNGKSTGDGANIVVTGGDNRIEGNTCTSADRGIQTATTGNIIVRNTCTGNTTNWVIPAGNFVLVISATSGAAINGNSGGGSLGSTDPSANFTY